VVDRASRQPDQQKRIPDRSLCRPGDRDSERRDRCVRHPAWAPQRSRHHEGDQHIWLASRRLRPPGWLGCVPPPPGHARGRGGGRGGQGKKRRRRTEAAGWMRRGTLDPLFWQTQLDVPRVRDHDPRTSDGAGQGGRRSLATAQPIPMPVQLMLQKFYPAVRAHAVALRVHPLMCTAQAASPGHRPVGSSRLDAARNAGSTLLADPARRPTRPAP